MTRRKTKSFKVADRKIETKGAAEGEPPLRGSPISFWRKLFGGGRVTREALSKGRAPGAGVSKGSAAGGGEDTTPIEHSVADSKGAQSPSLPKDLHPRNTKSFIAKKFNSQSVKSALMNAIGEAMDRPPADLTPLECQLWTEGLARKGILVDQLDNSKFKPDEHLRAIQWLAKIERLHPLKTTYLEDLFALRYQLATLHVKDQTPPESVVQGGIALRRLSGAIRAKLESLESATPTASSAAQKEIDAYATLLDVVESAPIPSLAEKERLALAGIFRRVDPYRMDLTGRHPRFKQNIADLKREMEAIYVLAPVPEPTPTT